MKTASYFSSLDDMKVRCELCPHHCVIPKDRHGVCLTRGNRDGTLVSLNYCRPVSTAIDPIEKKPLYHFHPGSDIFSTGPNGCNLKCSFCQNSDISQEIRPTRELTPEKLTEMIVSSGTIGAAYTYSEPYIWFETIMDVGAAVKERGLVNVMVTNGYMEPGPLNDLLSVVDAMNIDIKSMNPGFYKTLCKGDLAPVLKTCEAVKKHCHLEITNLLITGENDSIEEVGNLAVYIADNLGRDTPLHISRYFPCHRFSKPATPEQTVIDAWETARQKLDYVYIGNLRAGDKGDTFCPSCGSLLVKRSGYSISVTENLISSDMRVGLCRNCGKISNIVFP